MYRWVYSGTNNDNFDSIDLLLDSLHSNVPQRANCFDLSLIMVEMAKEIGDPPEDCFSFEINNFCSKKSEEVEGPYESFDPVNLLRNSDGLYEFDKHCIAVIQGKNFDICLQAKYNMLSQGVDCYNALSLAMLDNNLEEFKYFLVFIEDVNEMNGGTLLHNAYSNEQYEFAKFLLENHARDDIHNEHGMTALDILNINLSRAVNTGKLKKIKEIQSCFASKMDMAIKNSAATSIQSLWKGFSSRKLNSISAGDDKVDENLRMLRLT